MRRRLVPAAVAVAIGAFVIAAGVLAQHAFFPGPHDRARQVHAPGGDQGEDLDGADGYWTTRLTYPTGEFNPDWIRRAVAQDARVPRAAWTGKGHRVAPGISSADGGDVGGGTGSSALTKAASTAADVAGPTAAATAPFVSLGPKPLHMPAVAVVTTTATPRAASTRSPSIRRRPRTARSWRTRERRRRRLEDDELLQRPRRRGPSSTDDPLISTTSIDSVAIDPNDHNTVYAGTGDLNYGSFSMGSQGILKSTDGGATLDGARRRASSARRSPSRPASSRSTTPSARCASIRTTATTSSPARRAASIFSYDGGVNWTGPA